ncbi:META domain-containing protein [Dysgonomonas sp. 520]|uniref:META domain-containing protein n=1 Tax=Dysgonomonas sp. 520 TaxID=2302931 RepID=UPI0013D7DD77|nr:META domain-containing protein [Dysgonomonas sp. 520]NDW08796.1 META domain-containing protein [Dysgonomonas sp. 520]
MEKIGVKGRKKLSVSFMLLCFVGLFLNSCSNKVHLTPEELNGYWVLKSINEKDANELFQGAIPTIEFDFSDGNVFGSCSCNSYHGRFKLENNTLSISNMVNTEKMCLEPNAEKDFLQNLINENTLSVEGEELIFTCKDKVVLVFTKGDQSMRKTSFSRDNELQALLSGGWTLEKLNGADASIVFVEETPTLNFDFKTNRVTGFAGCNHYHSQFRAFGDTLIILSPELSFVHEQKDIANPSLIEECPYMENEQAYINVLADTTLINFVGDNTFQLMKDGSAILEFGRI